MGGFYYSGEDGSITAGESLTDPYDKLVKVYDNDFLHLPYLQQVITDQHYVTRKRQGRHVVFLSRIITDWNTIAKGIAADERTAVCMDEHGQATVIGTGTAYFLITDKHKRPELCQPGKALDWNHNHQAIKVYQIQATPGGNGSFDIARFNIKKATSGNWQWWWVEDGVLNMGAN